ncbi:MAG: FlgD Ig-like domain, partial [Pseudonocardiales bacterium]|nr:FlgD Ig-like domain [Pseudonocardiales bacterium]
DPAAFATMNVDCPSGTDKKFLANPASASHDATLVRYAVTAGKPYLIRPGMGVFPPAGTVLWQVAGPVAAGESPSVDARCTAASAFTATFYDRPSAPSTFAGEGGDPSGPHSNSELGFIAPSTAQYVADLTLTSGAVQLSEGTHPGFAERIESFASSGQFHLGTLEPGAHSMTVQPLDGASPKWSITIRALPVVLAGLKFSKPVTRPGEFVQAGYTVTGDTSVTAVIRDANGQTVRTLASKSAVKAGERTLAWDGKSDSGGLVADGPYLLTVDTVDPSGQTSSATASIVVDGTPPVITVNSAATLGPRNAVSGRISDALSGINTTKAAEPSRYTELKFSTAQDSFTLLPRSGEWKPGTHDVTITATDGAGNQSELDYRFRVVDPTPSCNKPATRTAARRSGSLLRAMRERVGGDLDYYVPGTVLCRDLNGDGIRDMTVLFQCCTVSSPSVVAVFAGTQTGRYRLAYMNSRDLVFGISLRRRKVLLRSPRYRRSDANCCPSSYRRFSVHFVRGQFVLRKQ